MAKEMGTFLIFIRSLASPAKRACSQEMRNVPLSGRSYE
jgi:hypothetical protein